jgi:hypothetical protein
LPDSRIVCPFCGVVVNAHLKSIRIALVESVTLADNPPVALFQIGRTPGRIKVVRGHKTFLDIHARAHFGRATHEYANPPGLHIGKQLCFPQICVGIVDEGDLIGGYAFVYKFALYIVVDGKPRRKGHGIIHESGRAVIFPVIVPFFHSIGRLG